MVMGELARAADVVVIGAGPGGYVAAIRAAQLGRKVTLIEANNQLGGVCLHHGCIPSKALITAANLAHTIKHNTKEMGIEVAAPRINKKQMQKWKQGVITKLTGGIEGLLKKHNIEYIQGKAVFKGSKRIRVTGNGGQTINFKHCIIATGSRPLEIPGFKFDGKIIVSSKGALQFDKVPKTAVVIGGGYIGCELGIVLAKLGCKVTMVQRGEHLLPFVPTDITSILEHHMEELGIHILFKTSAKEATTTKSGATVTVEKDGKEQKIKTEKVLVAVGRKPNTQDLGLNHTRVELNEKGFIKVDEQMRTKDHHIFAIGDIVAGPALAHKASAEGKVAAGVIAGKPEAFDQVIPAVIFTEPEIAMVGLTEKQAQEQNIEIKTGKFPFSASGRALTMNHTTGFVKVIADKQTGLVLGVEMIGPEVSNLISEAVLAIELGATTEDLALSIHPHPTLPEAISEAAEAVNKMAIHLYQGRSQDTPQEK